MATLSFSPGPIPAGQLNDWQKTRTLSHVVNPSGTAEIGAFATTKTDFASGSAPVSKGTFHAERAVFFGRWDHFPHHLVPLYTKTYTLFDSLQQIAEQELIRREQAGGSSSDLPSSEQVSFYSRLASLYIDTLRQHLASTASPSDEGPSQDESEWAATTQIFHLAKILYIPEDGRGEGVVGEELLDWANRVDPGPTTEEGEEILDTSTPWEHEKFWNYLIRSLLRGFLASAAQLILTLSSHPSPTLSRLAPRLSSLLEAYPRSSSSSYTTERSFLTAHSAWRSQLRTLVRTIASSGWAREGSWTEDENEGDAEELEARVKEVVEVLEGTERRVLEESADWSEALGAWGIWVRPSLKRDDLPETTSHLLGALPPPPEGYLPEELILQALCTSDLTKAITLSNTSISSPWLVTHLTDLLEKVGVLEPKLEDRTRSLRDHFVLEYAEHLGSDKGLWRMACSYLGTCGEEGKRRVGVLLERVSLDVEGADQADEVDEDKVDEVFKMMQSFGLEEESRTLLRMAGEQMIRRRNYGVAVAYCIRAGDGRRLGVIAEKVLDEYVRNGPTDFIEHVNSIPPSLFSPDSPHYIAGPSSSGPSWANGHDGQLSHHHEAALANPTFPVLASRLSFLPMYRDFLEAYSAGEKRRAAELLVKLLVNGVAPMGFWAILLLDAVPLLEDPELLIPSSDAYELLRHLEEVVSASSHSPSDYLMHLTNLQSAKKPASKSQSRMPNGTVPSAIPGVNEQEEGWAAALKGLEVVRLALARYLAREVLG